MATTAEADGHWTARAACGSGNVQPDELFVEGAAQRDARSVCQSCIVRLECLADALDSRTDFGVWGGMTERERRALRRRRPEVECWRDELVGADDLADVLAR
ncbi:WhiB family transcriptional regulator [Cellulomonas triticagri]|uniref:Transcriptional regulator WhiB n=1 Tax=Cellulomonas triticagri TaxID=2483352 RepID=A0A3M2J6K3_9CELL|nr:WhiB family transcriptional regulator [Cellulomonas triticagri]RMI09752.1 WhiB family transcriptional regulator [Cellulomonas triticagri]